MYYFQYVIAALNCIELLADLSVILELAQHIQFPDAQAQAQVGPGVAMPLRSQDLHACTVKKSKLDPC